MSEVEEYIKEGDLILVSIEKQISDIKNESNSLYNDIELSRVKHRMGKELIKVQKIMKIAR